MEPPARGTRLGLGNRDSHWQPTRTILILSSRFHRGSLAASRFDRHSDVTDRRTVLRLGPALRHRLARQRGEIEPFKFSQPVQSQAQQPGSGRAASELEGAPHGRPSLTAVAPMP
jgi:hypothetical protein